MSETNMYTPRDIGLFLNNNGYHCHQGNSGLRNISSVLYQRRIDTDDDNVVRYLCGLNNKLFINVIEHTCRISDENRVSYTVELSHENISSDWVSLEFCGLSSDRIINRLKFYEISLLNMWTLVNSQTPTEFIDYFEEE